MSALGNFTDSIRNTAGSAGISGSEDPATFVGNIIGALLSLLGLVLVVFTIYAGFLWMTAQGEEAQVKKAKAIIKNCVIGLIIIFASYAITTAVVSVLASGTTGGASQGPGSDRCLLDPNADGC